MGKHTSLMLNRNKNDKTKGFEGFQEVHKLQGWECPHANKSGKPPAYEGDIIMCGECKAKLDGGAFLVDSDGGHIDIQGEITVEDS